MKKCLLLIMSFLCLSFSAQAAEGLDVNVRGKGTEITVNGTASPNGKVSVFVSKTVRATEYKDVVFAEEITCDTTGEFSIVFNMPDKLAPDYDATGSYTVYIASEGYDKAIKPLEYVSLKKQNELLKTLNEKTEVRDIKSLLLDNSNKNAFESMGINISGYKVYSSLQNDIAESIFNSKPYAKISDFEAKYNDAFATALINNSTNVSNLSSELKNGGYINFVIDGTDISKDANYFNAVLDYVLKHKRYNDISEVEKAMRDGVVVYDLKNANKVTLTEVVKKYAEYIGVKTHSKYSAYENNATMQITVNEKTILNLPSGGADSIEMFVEKFTEQLNAYKAPTPVGGSGGGSGSGSGSGSFSGGIVVSGISDSIKPSVGFTEQDVFSDMEGFDWAKEAVEYLHKKGIVHGTGDTKFSPEDNVTREQFTKMIVEFTGVKENAELPFDDVQPGEWYCDYIKTAYSVGIINGISENLFGTGSFMTREDAVVIIGRCMDLLKITANDVREYTGFSDEDEIADYAKESVVSLYKKGIINGIDEGIFAPKATVTRAQAAKMIYELCEVREK